jgi:hypothetical protein
VRRRSDVTDTENIIPEVCTRARVAFDSVDVPSLRPTPPKRYALVPTTVNECPERGSGGVPVCGAGSHVTDCKKEDYRGTFSARHSNGGSRRS